MEQKLPDTSAELYQTIEASRSSPLLLYTSATEHIFMRVAVASTDFEEPMMWSQCLHLDDDTEVRHCLAQDLEGF